MRKLCNPQFKLTLGAEEFIRRKMVSAQVIREENAYDTAVVALDNMPEVSAVAGDAATLEVKDSSDAAYTTVFAGTVLFPSDSFGDSDKIGYQLVGTAYPLNMMNVAEEYGVQSRNPAVDTVQTILTDASVGVIPMYVEKYFAGTKASGYTVNTDNVADITGSIPYLCAPYKPANKLLDDLLDLAAAINGAGAHWMVDADSNLYVKNQADSQGDWTYYYGGSQAAATLRRGVDFHTGTFQLLGKEANVIVYYGAWRRPSSGDAWTENSASNWGTAADTPNTTITDETTVKIVGEKSIKITLGSPDTDIAAIYPLTANANWDFSGFTDFNTPSLTFYIAASFALGVTTLTILLKKNSSEYYRVDLDNTLITAANKLSPIQIPVGPYSSQNSTSNIQWDTTNAPSTGWAEINYIEVRWITPTGTSIYVDGLHFGSAAICRVARERFPTGDPTAGTLGTTANPIRTKVLTDNVGKDDSLTAADDSGLMAQLAKAELLRLATPVKLGKFVTSIIPDFLPGQHVYLPDYLTTAATHDWRVTKLTHNFTAEPWTTAFEVTDDVVNSHSRTRYEDVNKQYAAMRPEWQDRQASSIKSGNLDIRISRLETSYPL